MKYKINKHSVSLNISLDGPRERHNQHRVYADNNTGTFDDVIEKLELIYKICPEYINKLSINSVVDTKYDFKTVSDFFNKHELLKNIDVMLGPINENYTTEKYEISRDYFVQYNYEIFKYWLYKLNKILEKSVSKIFSTHFAQSEDIHKKLQFSVAIDSDKDHHSGPCIPGCRKFFVTVEGNFFHAKK